MNHIVTVTNCNIMSEYLILICIIILLYYLLAQRATNDKKTTLALCTMLQLIVSYAYRVASVANFLLCG